jgi:hypothetical protein
VTLLHAAGYYPPPSFGSTPPIRITIELDDGTPDRTKSIPQWTYAIEVKLANSQDWKWGGTIEAMNEEQAQLRVYGKAVGRLGELLADFVTRIDAINEVKK